MKKVSVIVPAYNSSKYLKGCLKSLEKQTYKEKEIILINDASTDNTHQILREYERSHLDVSLIETGENIGVGACRNLGIEHANGDYLSFVDSDDKIEPTFLEDMVTALEQTKAHIAICGYDPFILVPDKTNIRKMQEVDLKEHKERLLTIFGSCWNKMYDRRHLGEIKFLEGKRFEDFPTVYPLLMKEGRYVEVLDILYHYRRNFHGLTLSAKKEPNEDLLDMYDACLTFEENYDNTKEDDTFDDIANAIAFREMSKLALDSSLWICKDKITKEKIVNRLYFIAKRYYGCEIEENEFLKYVIDNNFLYRMRYNNFKKYYHPSFESLKEDKEILEETKRLIKVVKRG